MFANCGALEELKLQNFDTQNVKYMKHMFSNCTTLTSLDLSSFNIENIENMEYMFYGCEALKSLNLSNFYIHYSYFSNIKMDNMFYNCIQLEDVDISNIIITDHQIHLFDSLPENCKIKMNRQSENKIVTIPSSCTIDYNEN